jgi:hypothetical protein
MKQTVTLHGGKVFLREGWYKYEALLEVLEKAGKLSKEDKEQLWQPFSLEIGDERKDS